MIKGKKKIVEYRRKREGRTNYRKRLKLLSSNKLRLVIRKSLKNITSQLVGYDINGDQVVLGASSKELEKEFNWKFNRSNIPAAYLTGLLLGVKAKKKGIKKAILDMLY
jgi:large subunit ribosomal protein L18